MKNIDHPHTNRWTKSPRARHWCFTVNNYEFIPKELPPHCTYVVMGKEVGEEETPHLQSYAQFTKSVRRSVIQKWCKKKCWAMPKYRKSTPAQCRNYCIKDDDFVEIGSFSGVYQGQRTDIEALVNAAQDLEQRPIDVCNEMPNTYGRYWKTFHHVRGLVTPPLRLGLRVHLYEGPPGTGKTRKAYEENDDLYILPVGTGVWFDGYQGQSCALLDDFSGQMQLKDILRVLDIYPIQTQIKCSHTWFTPMKIIITTNVPLDDWYDYTTRRDSKWALKRRFHEHLFFNEDGTVEERPVDPKIP